MTSKNNDKSWDGVTERRKRKGPRRRLVDLTLAPGSNRRGKNRGRRKEDRLDEPATERPEKNSKAD